MTLRKKLTAAAIAAFVVICVNAGWIDEAAATRVTEAITVIAASFMAGQGLADFAKHKGNNDEASDSA